MRSLARKTKDGPQARRLLALAAIYDGATRTEAAKIGGVGLQIIRDWVLRFNARGPDGVLDGKSPGQPPKLNDSQRQALARMIERSRRSQYAMLIGITGLGSACKSLSQDAASSSRCRLRNLAGGMPPYTTGGRKKPLDRT